MKITNKTKYRTDDLKKFIYWVARKEGHESSYTKRLRVEAVPSRRWHTGCAYLGSHYIKIRLPGPDILTKPKLASVIAHEMMHNHQKHSNFQRVTTERRMRGSSRYGYYNNEQHWAEANELELRLVEPKAKKVKGPHDRALEGQAKAAKKVQEYERKIKRQQNLLKKWRKKLKYYDKRVEVTKDLPPPEPKPPKEKKPAKKIPVVYRDGEDIVVTISEAAYGELQCTEIDTFEAETAEEYGSEQGFRERKAFCEAMGNAQVLGKKMFKRRFRLRLNPDAAEHFAHGTNVICFYEEHPTAARTLEERQWQVGGMLAQKAASEGKVYEPVRGRKLT